MIVKKFKSCSLIAYAQPYIRLALCRAVRRNESRDRHWSRTVPVLILTLASALGTNVVVRAKDNIKPTGDWKPRIHFFAAPSWINDPNGPILLNGQYNLFFQNNPYGDEWGHMSWGHAVSTDLVHWTRLPVALLEEDGIMNFSGSVVEDRNNTSGLCGNRSPSSPACFVAIYTEDSKPDGRERQNQNLAFSRDGGLTWTKYARNPVLDLMLNSFRDPKVFWYEPTRCWIMIVMFSDLNIVQIFKSTDLKHWKFASKFGPAGATGGVWECPDLMNLDVRDSSGKRIGSHWVLSVNLNPGGVAGGSGNQYFLGEFDGTRFTEDRPTGMKRWVDWGKDFYASTSFANIPADENRLWIAWMNNWQYASDVPPLPGRGEMTVARRLYLRRETGLDGAESFALVQEPVLPRPADVVASRALTVDEANKKFGGKEPGNSVYMLRALLERGNASEMGIRLRRSSLNSDQPANEETVVGVDWAKGEVFVDRTRSGYVSFSPDFPIRTVAPLKHPETKTVSIEIVVDRSSVEVFAEDGETVLTNLIYPADASQGLAFYAAGAPAGAGNSHLLHVELVPLR